MNLLKHLRRMPSHGREEQPLHRTNGELIGCWRPKNSRHVPPTPVANTCAADGLESNLGREGVVLEDHSRCLPIAHAIEEEGSGKGRQRPLVTMATCADVRLPRYCTRPQDDLRVDLGVLGRGVGANTCEAVDKLIHKELNEGAGVDEHICVPLGVPVVNGKLGSCPRPITEHLLHAACVWR